MAHDRRSFVLSTLGIGGSLSLGGCASSASAARKLFDLSLAEWSLNRRLHAGELDARDFAPLARAEWDFAAVEHVNTFFMDKAEDGAYLDDMKRRADDAGVRSLLIMCDAEGELGDADDGARRRAVENHHKWIRAAHHLGCHSIRVNAGGQGSRAEVSKRAADSLHALATYGDTLAIDVIVENHGGYSSDGAWLAATIRAADHPRAGTLPDFGNFHLGNGEWYDRYKGVEELMPFARGVSAKSHEFDAAGNETKTDYRRMLPIVLAAGYHGFIGVEFEGDGVSEQEGIRLTRDLLLRVRAELAG
ncbi:MAG: sugar phosphate isomerase/epimerase family protein [Planctomycetota bacterium]